MSKSNLPTTIRQRKSKEPSFIENPQKQYNARIYRYTRNLDAANLLPSKLNPKFTQHWGVMINYLDEDEDEHLPARYLYEANDENGKLWARYRFFTRRDEERTGATLEHIADQLVCKDEVEEFCQIFNQSSRDYEFSEENCQKFTNELLIRLGLPTKYAFINFLHNAAYAVSESFRSSYISLGNVVTQYFQSSLISSAMKKTISDAVLKLQITACEKAAEQLVTEIIENGLYKFFKGAFCWWQLFQVFSEIIARFLTEKLYKEKCGLDEKDASALAYGSSKVVSLTTAAIVGGCTAGPPGVAGGVVFWLVAEILFAIIRSIASYFAGEELVDKIFGQADYNKFFDTCQKIVIPKIEEICATMYKFYFHQ